MTVALQNFYSFQITQAVTNTAQVIQAPGIIPGAEAPHTTSAIIKALKGNGGSVYLGPPGVTAATGYILDAGETIAVDTLGLSKLYMNGASGNTLSVLLVGP
jgi:hypothetical protein